MVTKLRGDLERLSSYDKLVQTLAANCPLRDDAPSPTKVARWKRAYNALFNVYAAAAKVA